jgi:hypothetical protein
MGLIGWPAGIGFLCIGAAIGVWNFTEINKTVVLWSIGVPGAILIVFGAGFEIQKFATPAPSKTADLPLLVARISGPYIDEKIYPLTRIKEGEGPRWIEIKALVEIENTNDTPATIVKSSLGAQGVMGPPDDDDVFEILHKGEKYYPLRRPVPDILKNMDEFKYVTVAGFVLDPKVRDQIFQQAPPIVGKLQYMDPLGKRRELGYAFVPKAVWNPSGFSRWGGEKYNYDREIKD